MDIDKQESTGHVIFYFERILRLPTSSLPLDLRTFLMSHFESVTQLEILFTFFTRSEITWTPNSMSRELRSHPVATTKLMKRLAEQGFVCLNENENYSYKPNPEIESMVKAIYILYQEKPVAVIACIYDKPNDKLKGFADAFKLKKD
ncbi:MAG TPA: hypothetical protein VNJ08_14345 [Bacteriovoracaceae bacterium]|nr:hypothetical protein [Bacteriovoracaceae bacterium]